MSDFSIRQGTIYESLNKSQKFMIINHNPMAMEAIFLEFTNGIFDLANPKKISIETLISIRKSGQFNDCGDVDGLELKEIITNLSFNDFFPAEEKKILESLLV